MDSEEEEEGKEPQLHPSVLTDKNWSGWYSGVLHAHKANSQNAVWNTGSHLCLDGDFRFG